MALVEWIWCGHHPTYFYHFAAALLDLGVNVLPLCPTPDSVRKNILSLRSNNQEAELYEQRSVWYPDAKHYLPKKLREPEQNLRHFARLTRNLVVWQLRTGRKIDLVFFACIYDPQLKYIKSFTMFFRYAWSGLYLHARAYRMPGTPIPGWGGYPCPERIFSTSTLHSVALLDEGVVSQMKGVTGGKPVYCFPDFTDATLPESGDSRSNLGSKIREFAKGRPIILSFGYLQKTKGLWELTRATAADPMKDVCFVFVGEVDWKGYTPGQVEEIQRCWEQAPNIYTYLQRVSDEATLNSVIQSSDVIFAAYMDFPNSSNVLNKAAAFRKPVIVSAGYLMAERTEHYRLGVTVREGSVPDIVDALSGILFHDKSPKNPDWDGYRETHSLGQLRNAFNALITG